MSIISQNKVVRNYSVQLRSAIISDNQKRNILKKMKSELIAEQYNPQKRSAYTSQAIQKQKSFTAQSSQTQQDTSVQSYRTQNIVSQTSRTQIERSILIQNAQNAQNAQNVKQKSMLNTNIQVPENELNTAVDKNFIQTQQNSEYIKTAKIRYSADVQAVINQSKELDQKAVQTKETFRRKYVLNLLKQKRRRYTVAKMESENSNAIEMVQAVETSAHTVTQAAETVNNTVKTTSKVTSKIATAVKHKSVISGKGSIKDLGWIATGVGGGIRNIAKDTGSQILKTKIDKSKITDSGTEAIKQGITDIRYVDNARKAVSNTAKATVKTGQVIRDMPKKTVEQARRIRRNTENAKNAVITVAKAASSNPIVMGLLIVLLLPIIIVLVGGLLLLIVAAISSMFSWLVDEDDSKSELDVLGGYQTYIVEYIEEKQIDIDDIVDGFILDKRQYPPYDSLDELNKYGNSDIDFACEDEAIAILAVLRYRELEGSDEEVKLSFTEEEIAEMLENFYTFEYNYTTGSCNYPYCTLEETEIENPDGSITVTQRYYCPGNHTILNGEVTNIPLDDVLTKYSFTDDEKELYEMYLEQIKMMNEMSEG